MRDDFEQTEYPLTDGVTAGITDWLNQIGIAAPCTADWEKMQGDERVRFCGECQLHVYNLSGMSRPEAEALIQGKQEPGAGRLCVRFYRRADGTILTQDCPIGVERLHQSHLKLSRQRRQRYNVAAAVVTLVTLTGLFSAGCAETPQSPPELKMGEVVEVQQPVRPAPKLYATGGYSIDSVVEVQQPVRPAPKPVKKPGKTSTKAPPSKVPTMGAVPIMGKVAAPPAQQPSPSVQPALQAPANPQPTQKPKTPCPQNREIPDSLHKPTR